jgi:hypothetical protein
LRIALMLEGLLRWAAFTTVLNRTSEIERVAVDALPIATLRRAISFAYAILPFPKTCLRESLVLRRMCARRGAWTELRFGVQRVTSGLAAHAWLEDADGRVLTEELHQYVPFPHLSGGRAQS